MSKFSSSRHTWLSLKRGKWWFGYSLFLNATSVIGIPTVSEKVVTLFDLLPTCVHFLQPFKALCPRVPDIKARAGASQINALSLNLAKQTSENFCRAATHRH